MNNSKECTICGIVKHLDEYYSFVKHSKSKGEYIYYNPYCRECQSKKSAQWQQDNWNRKKESNSKYKKTKKAKIKRNTIWMKSYRDRGVHKEWQTKNKDKMHEYTLKRAIKNHDISKEEWENCKNYFNYRCVYCGLAIEDHHIIFNGKTRLGDFHKDHVKPFGEIDLSNCIPACKNCNCQKWEFELEEWYNTENDNFSQERLNKIYKWLNEDYKKYIINKK